VLGRIVNDVLPAYGVSLWDDDSLVARLLAEQDADAQRAYRRTHDHSTLLAARRAFDEGSYQSAVDHYARLDPENLAATDRRRLHQARARLSSDSPDSK
jgi:hypothetical protein